MILQVAELNGLGRARGPTQPLPPSNKPSDEVKRAAEATLLIHGRDVVVMVVG
jgi:hypothetical protein